MFINEPPENTPLEFLADQMGNPVDGKKYHISVRQCTGTDQDIKQCDAGKVKYKDKKETRCFYVGDDMEATGFFL